MEPGRRPAVVDGPLRHATSYTLVMTHRRYLKIEGQPDRVRRLHSHAVSTARTTVATWNIEWATSRGRRGPGIRDRLGSTAADILVVTEGQRDVLPDGGHVIDAGDDWGYKTEPDRRKVLVRSRQPLTEVTRMNSGAGAGRVVTALTETLSGPVRLLAVCIPWSRAHVTTGRRDAAAWSEHLECLDQIEELIGTFDSTVPVIVAGDFNQKIPRAKQPIRVAHRLAEVMDVPYRRDYARRSAHRPHRVGFRLRQRPNLAENTGRTAFERSLWGRLRAHAALTSRPAAGRCGVPGGSGRCVIINRCLPISTE